MQINDLAEISRMWSIVPPIVTGPRPSPPTAANADAFCRLAQIALFKFQKDQRGGLDGEDAPGLVES
jgi:hypothetical protein